MRSTNPRQRLEGSDEILLRGKTEDGNYRVLPGNLSYETLNEEELERRKASAGK